MKNNPAVAAIQYALDMSDEDGMKVIFLKSVNIILMHLKRYLLVQTHYIQKQKSRIKP